MPWGLTSPPFLTSLGSTNETPNYDCTPLPFPIPRCTASKKRPSLGERISTTFSVASQIRAARRRADRRMRHFFTCSSFRSLCYQIANIHFRAQWSKTGDTCEENWCLVVWVNCGCVFRVPLVDRTSPFLSGSNESTTPPKQPAHLVLLPAQNPNDIK